MCKKYLGMQMWPYEWGLRCKIFRITDVYLQNDPGSVKKAMHLPIIFTQRPVE